MAVNPITVRMILMDVSRVDALCESCWLPGLYKVVFAFEGWGVSMMERVVCFDCGTGTM